MSLLLLYTYDQAQGKKKDDIFATDIFSKHKKKNVVSLFNMSTCFFSKKISFWIFLVNEKNTFFFGSDKFDIFY